jgi:cholesterol oxidase
VTNWLNYLKVDLNAVRLLEGVSQLQGGFDVVPGTTQFEHEIDFAAWNLPVPPGEECKNPVCRRIFGIFGPSYTHAQLNEGTHNAMMEMFGKVALPPFEQLSLMTGRQLAVDHLGENRYVTAERAPNLALPITFITGAMNQIFVPESVARTLEWVRAHNGPEHYQQHVFEGYAHMDLFIGKNAADEVYPYLLEQLDRFNPVP